MSQSPLPPEPSVARQVDLSALARRLETHVTRLAADIGERNVWHPEALQAAADYIRAEFAGTGLACGCLPYEAAGQTVYNLDAELPGTDPGGALVIVGAHYDSVRGSPGANDNASGVAATIELLSLLRDGSRSCPIRFVCFPNEEPPFFRSRTMGSRAYAGELRRQGKQVRVMLSLETIGCYLDEPGSQQYPFPLRFFYPDCGNFIGFVGNLASAGHVRRASAAFRAAVSFPCEQAALPSWIPGVGWSDQWSFWREGYPALMVTDTAPFRYEHYHCSTDTADKLDYGRMAQVVQGLKAVVSTFAQDERL
jgi:Zn-dependent M28 family amino/carboxypeptidase